ncbi:MAG TPA: cupin domain-containing protein [Chitinophagaceae bacterium]|nr:cupin domain-containing protein [Chitinophagaceae bacterium]
MMQASRDIIEHYGMQRHPEGGYFKETYRACEAIPQNALPARFKGDRFFSTAIYFLLEHGDFSAFHRIKSDECWHFYAGGTLLIYVINVSSG